jgi:hypothetical protein
MNLSRFQQGIQQGVFYPEGSHFHPPSKSKTPSVTVSVYDPPHQRTFKEFTKADRNIKTRSMAILTNFRWETNRKFNLFLTFQFMVA